MKQLIYQTLPWLRTFTNDKIVKSKWLNQRGLQVYRMKLADKKYSAKDFKIGEEYRNLMEEFRTNGILQFNNFLPKEEFDALRKECELIKLNEPWNETEKTFGPNKLYMFDLYTLDKSKYPALFKFFEHKELNDLFSMVEKRKINIANKELIAGFQYLVQGPDNGSHDPETDMHADTFFNTHKAWLYMDDVALENGPFTFVPKSHNIYLEGRLEREKAFSTDITSKGSRRITEEELKELGLEEKVYTCKANTLVIANTLGYHRRLRGADGHDRLTIAFSARANPFF